MDNIKSSRKGDAFPPLQKTALRYYSMRFCPFAQRTRLVLEHKQLPFETVNIDLANKPDWFWERNPEGTVPILEKGGQVVTESTACCDWLDDVYTHNRLTPRDPYIKARDRILLEYFSHIIRLFYGKLRKSDTMEEGIQDLHKRFQFFEGELAKRDGPLYGGTTPSMIDFLMWPHMERLPVLAKRLDPRMAVTMATQPRLAAWYSAMYEVPAVKATMLDHDTHDVFLKAYEVDPHGVDYDYGII